MLTNEAECVHILLAQLILTCEASSPGNHRQWRYFRKGERVERELNPNRTATPHSLAVQSWDTVESFPPLIQASYTCHTKSEDLSLLLKFLLRCDGAYLAELNRLLSVDEEVEGALCRQDPHRLLPMQKLPGDNSECKWFVSAPYLLANRNKGALHATTVFVLSGRPSCITQCEQLQITFPDFRRLLMVWGVSCPSRTG
jgi:hypothetical protein